MQIDSKPEALDELDRRIMQLKIEREALKKETDKASRDRLVALEGELGDLEDKSATLTAKWQEEKKSVADVQAIKEKLDAARQRGRSGPAQGRFRPRRRTDLWRDPGPGTQAQGDRGQQGRCLSGEAVTAENIAAVVSRWTGIPVDKMLEGEREKLLHMESDLEQRVVGQHEAVRAISNAVRRARAGLQDPNRPIGSSCSWAHRRGQDRADQGAGRFLFDDDTAMVRIDMSEFMEKHAVARLIGARPAMSAMRRAACSPKRCGGGPIR
jgi:ATP-dependent Clp protease ATP-binding subunit ClpB